MQPRDYLARPYWRAVVPESDGTYTAIIVEFPGCIATGTSAAEAFANVESVAESWLSIVIDRGQSVPEPLETVSGAKARRPALAAALKQVRRGDTFVVWKLDRLGRNLLDLLHRLKDFESRGVEFRSITEGAMPMTRHECAGCTKDFPECCALVQINEHREQSRYMDRWYEPPTGMTLQDRLRRPLVSHAPDGAITDSDLARQLVDDRADALVRIAELEAALRSIRGALFIRSDISPNAYKRIMEEIEKVLPETTST